jgi:hypothetical protein
MRLRCERVRRGKPQAIYLSVPKRLELDQFPRTPLLLSSVNERVAPGVDSRKPKSTTTRRPGSLLRDLPPRGNKCSQIGCKHPTRSCVPRKTRYDIYMLTAYSIEELTSQCPRRTGCQ